MLPAIASTAPAPTRTHSLAPSATSRPAGATFGSTTASRLGVDKGVVLAETSSWTSNFLLVLWYGNEIGGGLAFVNTGLIPAVYHISILSELLFNTIHPSTPCHDNDSNLPQVVHRSFHTPAVRKVPLHCWCYKAVPWQELITRLNHPHPCPNSKREAGMTSQPTGNHLPTYLPTYLYTRTYRVLQAPGNVTIRLSLTPLGALPPIKTNDTNVAYMAHWGFILSFNSRLISSTDWLFTGNTKIKTQLE